MVQSVGQQLAVRRKSGFFNRLGRAIGFTSTGGWIGYAVSSFIFLPLPTTVVVIACAVGGALVAKATGKSR